MSIESPLRRLPLMASPLYRYGIWLVTSVAYWPFHVFLWNARRGMNADNEYAGPDFQNAEESFAEWSDVALAHLAQMRYLLERKPLSKESA